MSNPLGTGSSTQNTKLSARFTADAIRMAWIETPQPLGSGLVID